jgi:hypothetical protein
MYMGPTASFRFEHARTIPAVSTISVAKWTLRKRIVLWWVLSIVGSYLFVQTNSRQGGKQGSE